MHDRANWSLLALVLAMLAPTMAHAADAPHHIDARTFPKHCVRGAAAQETVTVRFNTTALGEPMGARVATSSNTCLNTEALKVLQTWRFNVAGPGARLVPRMGVMAEIVFERKISAAAPERKVRGGIRRRLNDVRHDLADDRDPQAALDSLAQIDSKFGERFSLTERAAFLVLRATAHYSAGDFDRALNDLYRAKESTVLGPVAQTVNESIEEIEIALHESRRETPSSN